MKSLQKIYSALIWPNLAIFSLAAVASLPVCAQSDGTSTQESAPAAVAVDNSAAAPDTYNPETSGDRMATPPPVSGQTYPIALGSQERSNYLRTGVSFTSAYTDNVLGGVTGHPVSDISYSVAPLIDLDETTTRMHLVLGYAPGFTFYQRVTERNEADQNGSIEFDYRLSPHVTFSANDSIHKTSDVFSQPGELSTGSVSGGIQVPNFSIFAPVANQLSNSGNVGINYQFGLNDMVGASGTFSNLHYANQAEVPGLSDASSQGGLAFYSHRLARGQYIGATYAFQRLLAFPTIGQDETQTHAALLFYTFASSSSKFSVSFFGGPEYSDTSLPLPHLRLKGWNPAGGASLGWQAKSTSFALSYVHIISTAGGLASAVKQDGETVSVGQRLTRTLTASINGGYAENGVIGGTQLGQFNGHSLFGSASVQQMIGQHVGVQLGYTRLHQSYAGIPVISATPDTNRESVSISYQFSRPLGR